VEFTLVAPLVLLLCLAIVQIALALHVRATLTSAAAEGARAASLAGADPAAGVRRTEQLLGATLSANTVRDVVARTDRIGTLEVVVVRVEGVLPLVGLLGPQVLTVEGRAVQEGWV
jgi:Flp pilus assembly protein TadG